MVQFRILRSRRWIRTRRSRRKKLPSRTIINHCFLLITTGGKKKKKKKENKTVLFAERLPIADYVIGVFHLCGCDNYFEVKIWIVLFFPERNCDYGIDRKLKNRISVKYFDTLVFLFLFSFSSFLLNTGKFIYLFTQIYSAFNRDFQEIGYFYKNLF